ncbi:MAG: FAD-binding protein, partial [Gemmatimonadales bacterium]
MARAGKRGGAGHRGRRPAVSKAKPAAAKKTAKPNPKAKPAPKPVPVKAPPRPKIKGRLLENEPLAKYITFRIGGPARYVVLPAESADVAATLEFARQQGLPWLALGLGSNVLVKDKGFPGVVIRLGKGLDWMHEKSGAWRIGAGMPTPLLARKTAEAGWAGIHKLIGVPGTVGGGVFTNAGCHGSEFADVV